MTVEEYLRQLKAQKARAEARFENLTTVEREMLDAGYEFLLTNLDLRDGTFEVPGDLPKLMDDFVVSIVSVAENSKTYNNAFSNYLADIKVINKNIEDFQGTYNRITLRKPGIKAVQTAVIEEIINQYSANGLNKHFAEPLRNLMFGNVLGGMSQKEAKQHLKEYIIGGSDQSGKLNQYLTQTAQQGVDSYTGAINMKLKKEFDFTGYIISGSLIDNSSPQCRKAIGMANGGYLTFEEWGKILTQYSDKLIAGTTIENLPLNKLHWGCRHEFTPVIK